MIWPGTARCDMLWCSMGWTVTSWLCMVGAGAPWPGTARVDMAQFSMVGDGVPWLCKGGTEMP